MMERHHPGMRRQRRRTNGNEIRTSKQEGREEGGQPLRPKSAWQAANQLQWKAGGSGVGGIVVGGSSPIGGGRDGRTEGRLVSNVNARGTSPETDGRSLSFIAASFSSKKGAFPLPSSSPSIDCWANQYSTPPLSSPFLSLSLLLFSSIEGAFLYPRQCRFFAINTMHWVEENRSKFN